MPPNKYENYSTEELNIRIQKIIKVNSVILGIMVIYGIYMFYSMYTGTWNSRSPIIIIPLLLIIIVFANKAAIKRISSEISYRDNKNK